MGQTLLFRYLLFVRSLLWRNGCLLVLFCLFFNYSYAQFPNNQCADRNFAAGGIDLKLNVGCLPFSVAAASTVKELKNQRYIFDYRGGPPTNYTASADSNFIYTKTGVYLIMQIGEKDGLPTRACATVTVQDTVAPIIRLQLCSNGAATLTIPTDPANVYDEYGVQWGDGFGEIINKQTRVIKHQYADDTPKKVQVQGIHKLGKCGGKTTRTVSVKGAAQPATLAKLTIIDGSTAELTIDNPNENDWLLYRQENADPFTSSGKTAKKLKETMKVLVDTNQITCFKLKPLDTCAANVESNILCTNFIKVSTEADFNLVSIAPYRYPSEVKSLTVARNKTDWWKASRTEFNREDRDVPCNSKTCYQLKIETEKGVVFSNVVCVNPPPVLCGLLGDLFVPDAFSPNNDNINDLLEVKGDLTKDFKWLVYNKWGNVIFSSNNIVQGWNGLQDGQPAATGVYFYQIQVLDKSKRSFRKNGSFLLVR